MKINILNRGNLLIILFIFFIGVPVSYSQTDEETDTLTEIKRSDKFKKKLADNYFKRTYFTKAIGVYEKIIDKFPDPETVLKLAKSYYFVGRIEEAKGLFNVLIAKNSLDKDALFYYTEILKSEGDIDNAYETIYNYLEENADTLGYEAISKEREYIDNIIAIGDRYEISNLESVNTELSEFSAVRYEDDLVYTSNKIGAKKSEKTLNWLGGGFFDLYKTPIQTREEDKAYFPGVIAFDTNINTKLHESNAVFTKDEKTMYFTSNAYSKKRKNKALVNNLQIYKAEKINGQWTNVTPMPFNKSKYSFEHPALSPDESKLYFSSDLPNGQGSFDLYYVDLKKRTNKPINLGPKINTKRLEQFPYLTQDGSLYFSSNGHPSFGGLDVYVSKPNGDEFLTPNNVGLPMNSSNDDFSFYLDYQKSKVDKNKKYIGGYFSSNRKGGKGNDDIYEFYETKPLIIESCYEFVSGTVLDSLTCATLNKTNLFVKDTLGVTIDTIRIDRGRFEYKAACNKEYIFTIQRAGYKPLEYPKYAIGNSRKKQNYVEFLLFPYQRIFEDYTMALEKAFNNYDVLKWEQTKKRKSEAIKRINEEQEKINKLIEDKNFVKLGDRVLLDVEDIYFDVDRWYIRHRSKQILDKVVSILLKYPNMKIEIGVHSDIRGSVAYNKLLSTKRARSIKKYIVKKDIANERVVAMGYGESRPIIDCLKENCTEEDYEINRRSEFTIISN